jgi:Flp pilus assembly protein TadD
MRPLHICFQFLLVAIAASFVASCAAVHRVPPGQAVAFAMAKKADLVTMPPQTRPAASAPSATRAGADAGGAAAAHPEPELPTLSSDVEKVADSFTLGNLHMEQGQYADAITAYQQALKVNPNFAEAWSKLAVAYQNAGQDKKALEAYRKYKTLSSLSLQ